MPSRCGGKFDATAVPTTVERQPGQGVRVAASDFHDKKAEETQATAVGQCEASPPEVTNDVGTSGVDLKSQLLIPRQRTAEEGGVTRRTILRIGAAGGLGAAFVAARGIGGPMLEQQGMKSPDGVFGATSTAIGDLVFFIEAFPTSPLIVDPFNDSWELKNPMALRPASDSERSGWARQPGPGIGQQDAFGGTHQRWVDDPEFNFPDPILYRLHVEVAGHSFTNSKVLPINKKGLPTTSFGGVDGKTIFRAGVLRDLPKSTIYGFNGTFPGPRINAEYGKPAIVRFENHLDFNPDPVNLPRQDFGDFEQRFLIHLHNGHTAPESDGNPHYAMTSGPKNHGYPVFNKLTGERSFVDNLYLNWPAHGDEREKQSFFWFHDHTMDMTGANVYKGMVGLYPIYDPIKDSGEERDTNGYQLPGRRTDNSDGSFDVEYDVPLALYDCRLEDGVTIHKDFHDVQGEYPDAHNPAKHPEWWGQTFFKHFPNHGFVGDIFTVNGQAFPVMKVKRRRYRFRFLDASVSRIYELMPIASTNGPKSAKSLGYTDDDLDGQWRIEDGEQVMRFRQIATDGGLIPFPFDRDSFELWPAKRREFVVDFAHYMDGSVPDIGDEIFLT